jgi:hypothetical protein
MLKKILFAAIALLLLLQFYRPERNQSEGPFPQDAGQLYPMNTTVSGALKRACYDCHSNQTTYPWYASLQPVGIWLQHHVDEGKEHLNFNEFGSYPVSEQQEYLEEIVEVIKEGEMPLKSYTFIHKDAVLTTEEVAAISKWCQTNKNTIPETGAETSEQESKE